MKAGTVRAIYWGLALADYGRNPLGRDSLRAAELLFFFSVM